MGWWILISQIEVMGSNFVSQSGHFRFRPEGFKSNSNQTQKILVEPTSNGFDLSIYLH